MKEREGKSGSEGIMQKQTSSIFAYIDVCSPEKCGDSFIFYFQLCTNPKAKANQISNVAKANTQNYFSS